MILYSQQTDSWRLKLRLFLKTNQKLIFILSLNLLILTGCADRPRENPLDPLNSETNGKPVGTNIYSIKDTVTLTWYPLYLESLRGYRIYRYDESTDSDFLIKEVAPRTTWFEEKGLTYDRSYCYRISAITENYESGLSLPVCTTPGPTFTWLVASSPASVTRLTHDYLHVLLAEEVFGYPELIAVNPVDETAWIYDDFLDRIYHLDKDGNFLAIAYGHSHVADIEVSTADGGLWLLRQADNKLIKLDYLGEEKIVVPQSSGARCLAADRNRGMCFVGDLNNRQILGYNNQGKLTRQIRYDFHALRAMAFHQAGGDLWIADSTRLLKLNINSSDSVSVFSNDAFSDLYLIDVDQKSGDCWASDARATYKYDSFGNPEFRIENKYTVVSLSVNSYDGSCLFVEGYRYRLLKISEDGKSIEEISSVQYPAAVAVEY